MLRRIHILADNKAVNDHFLAEHGLSLLLEMEDGQTWLWDTGQGNGFLANANQMDLNVTKASGCALSHGHYDHTGGMPHLLQAGFHSPIVAHPGIFQPRFHVPPTGQVRPIGNPNANSAMDYPGFVGQARESLLTPGLRFMTTIPRRPGHFQAVAGFFFDAQGKLPDPVEDDACLVADTTKGVVLVLGCCHSGLANTLLEVGDRLGKKQIFAVVGGLHLMNSDTPDFMDTLTALAQANVQEVYAGHCTGQKAQNSMREQFPGKWIETKSGMTIEF